MTHRKRFKECLKGSAHECFQVFKVGREEHCNLKLTGTQRFINMLFIR